LKSIVLITTGQPSTNPRLVKEADLLQKAGFRVIVLYCFWSDWALKTDKEVLSAKKWTSILVGGTPENQSILYFFSRLRTKLFRSLSALIGNRSMLAERILCRCYPELLRKARSLQADLYIAHNLGALPVAVNAAKYHGAKIGFDAEDFHRGELSNAHSLDSLLIKYLEDQYIPQVDYLSVASPLIGEAYLSLFPRTRPVVINNVFPLDQLIERIPDSSSRKTVKLFWFSQTVGKNRGIEEIIQAMGMLKQYPLQLVLLGYCSDSTKTHFKYVADQCSVHHEQISFLEPVVPGQIVQLAAQCDIGLALEQKVSLNREICLTNKIFTYLLAGNAIIASDTKAQVAFMNRYPTLGKTYTIGNVEMLAAQVRFFAENRSYLQLCRTEAWQLAKNELNWDVEQQKFLHLIKGVLSEV